MKFQFSPWFRLHFIVFLWGFTGVIGKLISIEALPLVIVRMFFTFVLLYIILRWKKIPVKVSRNFLIQLTLFGGIIALHWWTFFAAIKVSTISIALSTLSTGAIFTALMEPIFFKRKLQWSEIVLSVIVSICIAIIFRAESEYYFGIVLGLICSFLSALFSILNAKIREKDSATKITFYELLGGCLLLFIISCFTGEYREVVSLQYKDLFWLLILSGLLTAFPLIESLRLAKIFSPFTILLTINLEPIYGIVISYFIWQDSEQMSSTFYICTLVLLLSVVVNGILKSREKKNTKKPNNGVAGFS